MCWVFGFKGCNRHEDSWMDKIYKPGLIAHISIVVGMDKYISYIKWCWNRKKKERKKIHLEKQE